MKDNFIHVINMWKEQLRKLKVWDFCYGFPGPKTFRDFRETGPRPWKRRSTRIKWNQIKSDQIKSNDRRLTSDHRPLFPPRALQIPTWWAEQGSGRNLRFQNVTLNTEHAEHWTLNTEHTEHAEHAERRSICTWQMTRCTESWPNLVISTTIHGSRSLSWLPIV